MTKRKVCVVVTARPSYSRIKTALLELKKNEDVELQLVVAASALLERFGNAIAVMEKDGFEITAKAYTLLEGEKLSSMAKTAGLGILELSNIFLNIRPDVVITIADRYETMSTAIAASFMNIPLIHVQGGEITGNIDEKVRHSISKLADVHLVSNEIAKNRLIKMGEEESSIFVTGCPSIDLAKEVAEHEESYKFNPFETYPGVGNPSSLENGYIVLMHHPVTTEYGEAKSQIQEVIAGIEDIDLPILWFWPNPDAGSDGTSKGIREFREKCNPDNIYFFKNMEPNHFLMLLKNSRALIGNSSVGIRECSYLGVPVVNIGERQSGRDRGRNVIDVTCEQEAIKSGINQALELNRDEIKDKIYGDGDAGKAISEAVLACELSIVKKLTY